MPAGVNTTLTPGTWRLLPSTAYHHHAIMGRRLCIICMLHLTNFDLARSSNYFCPSSHLQAEVGGCGHLLAEVEVPSYEGSDHRLYFVAVVQDKSKLSEGQKKALNQTVHVFLHFGTFCLFLFKIIRYPKQVEVR